MGGGPDRSQRSAFQLQQQHRQQWSRGFMDGRFGGAVSALQRCHSRAGSVRAMASSHCAYFRSEPSAVLKQGPSGNNVQRQINIVDSLPVQKGRHNLKFGVDFRRISPDLGVAAYQQSPFFLDVPSASSGNPFFGDILSGRGGTFHFHNLGVFAQDSWRVTPSLTVTYGLRWDVDFAPSSSPALLAATGFNLSDLSNLALAPAERSPLQTTYGNVWRRGSVLLTACLTTRSGKR